MHGWQRPSDKTIEVDLVCQAWFLRTEWVTHLFSSPPVIGTNGEDIELAARAWRLAGIRSFCPPHPPGDQRRWGSTRGMELGLDEVAASFRVEHLAERRQIVEAEIAAGWRPLFMRPEGDCKLQISNCKLQIGSSDGPADRAPLAYGVPPYHRPSAGHAPRDVGAAPVSGDTERYVQCSTECSPRWVTTYSYPMDDNGQERMPVPVRLRLDGGDEICCLDCLDEIESFGGRASSDAEKYSFDRIDCGSAPQRVRDPLAFLRQARRLLKPQGEFLATVANVRRAAVVERLIHGRWEEEPARVNCSEHPHPGPLPEGEGGPRVLWFFTRREIEKLFYRAGFRVNEICPSPCATASAAGGSPTEAEESTHERYQITATAEEPTEYGLTSIVIVTHNQLACTRACLDSIRFVTDEPYELIVVDNGSTDGTVDYLRSCPDVKLIANADNRGFPAAANQGIQASAGAQVLLLNNDVLVTTGWLRRMLEAMHGDENCKLPRDVPPAARANCELQIAGDGEPRGARAALTPAVSRREREHRSDHHSSLISHPSSSRIGLVGPLTNCASGYQEIRVTYDDTSCLDGFAWEHAKQHAGELHEVDRLIGFCLLIKREVINEIGLLDERFGIGNYEDDDYCRRARNAGWRLVVAREAFIHHFGHRTFAAAGVDLNSLLIRNRQVYDEKWAEQGTGNRAQGTEEETEVRSQESESTPLSLPLFVPPSTPPSPIPHLSSLIPHPVFVHDRPQQRAHDPRFPRKREVVGRRNHRRRYRLDRRHA
jgi:GT2 family glycosyltransferase